MKSDGVSFNFLFELSKRMLGFSCINTQIYHLQLTLQELQLKYCNNNKIELTKLAICQVVKAVCFVVPILKID